MVEEFLKSKANLQRVCETIEIDGAVTPDNDPDILDKEGGSKPLWDYRGSLDSIRICAYVNNGI